MTHTNPAPEPGDVVDSQARMPLRVTREVAAEDLHTLREYLKTRPGGRVVRRYEAARYFAVCTALVCAFLCVKVGPDPIVWMASPLVGGAISFLYLRYSEPRAEAAFIAYNKPALGHQEFWIDDEGFGNSTPAGMTFHKWKTIVAIERTAELIFISEGAFFYSIPLRGGHEDASRFHEEALRRWRSQQAKS